MLNRYAILLLTVFAAPLTTSTIQAATPCWMNFPDATEPCGALVTRYETECKQHHIDAGLCDVLGETWTWGYGHAQIDEWPYWGGVLPHLNNLPAWPACKEACMAIAPLWPDYAECCPSPAPSPPPPPAEVFFNGFESGDLSGWSYAS